MNLAQLAARVNELLAARGDDCAVAMIGGENELLALADVTYNAAARTVYIEAVPAED